MALELTWQAALERPDLLADPVRIALESLSQAASIEVTQIDPDLADTATLVEATGLPMADMGNCIVIAGSRAGEERVCASLVLGTTRANVNTTIRKWLGVRKCSFMAMDEAVGRTGMEYGGITPLGLPSDWPVLVDAAAIQQDQVIIGSGLRRSKLRLPGALLAQLPGVEVVEGLAIPA